MFESSFNFAVTKKKKNIKCFIDNIVISESTLHTVEDRHYSACFEKSYSNHCCEPHFWYKE